MLFLNQILTRTGGLAFTQFLTFLWLPSIFVSLMNWVVCSFLSTVSLFLYILSSFLCCTKGYVVMSLARNVSGSFEHFLQRGKSVSLYLRRYFSVMRWGVLAWATKVWNFLERLSYMSKSFCSGYMLNNFLLFKLFLRFSISRFCIHSQSVQNKQWLSFLKILYLCCLFKNLITPLISQNATKTWNPLEDNMFGWFLQYSVHILHMHMQNFAHSDDLESLRIHTFPLFVLYNIVGTDLLLRTIHQTKHIHCILSKNTALWVIGIFFKQLWGCFTNFI